MIFLYSNWLQLPIGTRIKIASIFGIPKVRSTHVSGTEILDDGYVIKDIESKITLATLQSHLNSTETDVHILWKDLLDEIGGKPKAPTALIVEPAVAEKKPKTKKKK